MNVTFRSAISTPVILALALLAGGCAFARQAPPAAPTPAAMPIAARVLAQADALTSESSTYLARAEAIRKEVASLRVTQREISDNAARAATGETIRALAAEIDAWEQKGDDLRDRSRELATEANLLLIDSFSDRWRPWISNAAPLVMQAVEYRVSGTPAVGSGTPKQGKGNPLDVPLRHQGMSIQVPSLPGQTPPADLNVSSFQMSRDRSFFAHVEVEPGDDGPAPVPLNRLHTWRLLVSDLNGNPVANARISIAGYMPGHVHGMPTSPEVTVEVEPGVYRVDGMKFQMNGWWVLQFDVDVNGHKDSVLYNLVL